jgi:predicted metalloprotease
VIAHEVGHHVQNLLNILPKAQQAQRSADSKAEANQIQVRVELRADCRRRWARLENDDLQRQGKPPFLEPGDVEAAMRTAAAIGDDTLQRKAQATWCPTASPTAARAAPALVHDRVPVRRDRACNTFAAAQL